MTKKKKDSHLPVKSNHSSIKSQECEDSLRHLIHREIQASEEEYSGPIPHPKLLGEYEAISPGMADRIFSMAESEMKHRHAMEAKAMEADIEYNNNWARNYAMEVRFGQWFAFIVTIFLAVIGAVVILNGGSPVAGSVISGLGVGGIITTFILGRSGTKEKDKNGSEQDVVKQDDDK